MPSWLFPGMPPVKFLRQKICSIFPAWVSGERHCHLLLLYQESKLLPKRKIPQVEISLKLNSTSTLSQRVREVVGKETSLKMLEIKKEPNEVQVGGFLGKPEVTKASRGEIRFFDG